MATCMNCGNKAGLFKYECASCKAKRIAIDEETDRIRRQKQHRKDMDKMVKGILSRLG